MSSDDAEKKKVEARRLLAAIHAKITDEFRRYEGIHYNTNTKGSDYEKVVADLIKEYLDSTLIVHVRSQLIDVNMEYLTIFDRGIIEVDVVGTYRTASPNIVLKIKDTEFIPYDTVAFAMEVKEQLDKQKLEDDLIKLQKI